MTNELILAYLEEIERVFRQESSSQSILDGFDDEEYTCIDRVSKALEVLLSNEDIELAKLAVKL